MHYHMLQRNGSDSHSTNHPYEKTYIVRNIEATGLVGLGL